VTGLTHSFEEEERIVDNNPQIVISVTNKDYNLIAIYKDLFGGNINIVSNGRYE
jgi:hypothetical protein